MPELRRESGPNRNGSAKTPEGIAVISTSARTVDFGRLTDRLGQIVTRTVDWLADNSLELAIGIMSAAVIATVLLAARRFGGRLCQRDASGRGWLTILGRAINKTGNFFILAVAARLVIEFTDAPAAAAGPIRLLFIVAATIQAAVWAREIILGFVEHRTEAGESETLGSAMNLIRLLVSIALFVVASIVILDNVGVNVTGLVAGLGIGGIAIGLAAQGIFADLFAALSILFDRPFRRGDGIAYDQTVATVEAIGLKSTRLRAISGEQRIISNKALLDKEIRNNSRTEYRRHRFPLALVYQTPPEKAAAVPGMLREIVEAEGAVFVRSGFFAFGPSSLDFEVEFDVPGGDYEHFYALRHAIGMAIVRRFAAEGITFAYPTQTTFTAAPDGSMVLPYAPVQRIEGDLTTHGDGRSS